MLNETNTIQTQDERYIAETAVRIVRKVGRRIRRSIPIDWEDANLVQVVSVNVETGAADLPPA
ncbi:MAG: hypothetical protein ACLFV7_10205 [Phycisphaerae bacterium]